MGMTWRPHIGHEGTCGLEMANYKVSQCLQGGQGQVSGPQVPLLGRRDEIDIPKWACRDYWT